MFGKIFKHFARCVEKSCIFAADIQTDIMQYKPDKQYDQFEVVFTAPEFPDSQLQELNNKLLCNHIKKGVENVMADVVFNDREDDESAVMRWMSEWCRLLNERKDNDDEPLLGDIFEVKCDDDNPFNVTYTLKKDIKDMSDDEKERVRNVLVEVFRCPENKLKIFGL